MGTTKQTGRPQVTARNRIALFSDPVKEAQLGELILQTQRTALIEDLMGLGPEVKTGRLKSHITRLLKDAGVKVVLPRGLGRSPESRSFLATKAERLDGAMLIAIHFGTRGPGEFSEADTNMVTALNKLLESYYRYKADMHPHGEPTFARGRRVAEKIASTQYKGRPLQRFIEESLTEATIYFTEPTTGLRMRVRLDAFHPDISFDLKSTRHGTARAFLRDAVDMAYDLQAYMYSLARCMYEGRKVAPPFVFIAAESTAPHSVSTLEAGENFMGNGALKFKACAAAFKACTQTGYWPDLGVDAVLELEPWQQFAANTGWQAGLASAQ